MFKIVMGNQPLTSNAFAMGYKGSSPSAFKFAKEWQEDTDLPRLCLHEATKRVKKFVNKKKRSTEYQVGVLVNVKLHLIQRNRANFTRAFFGDTRVLSVFLSELGRLLTNLSFSPGLSYISVPRIMKTWFILSNRSLIEH